VRIVGMSGSIPSSASTSASRITGESPTPGCQHTRTGGGGCFPDLFASANTRADRGGQDPRA
jgi:hypothetical protein